MSLEIKKLTKIFGTRKVLDGIDLVIPEGYIVFILGTSGTGKSVLLKNIVGLLRPESGEIWLDGQEISTLPEKDYFAIRKKCGMVFQHPALFDSLTIYENVAFGLRRHFPALTESEIAARVKKFLALVGLRDIEKKTSGPNQLWNAKARESGADGPAIEPRYLLFDEPTTGLDPVTTNAINQLIKSLSKTLKTTSLVVSHDMHCAMDIADKIVVLDKGRVIEQGTPADLRKSSVPLVSDFLRELNGYERDSP